MANCSYDMWMQLADFEIVRGKLRSALKALREARRINNTEKVNRYINNLTDLILEKLENERILAMNFIKYEKLTIGLEEQLDAAETKCKKLKRQKRTAWCIANKLLKQAPRNPRQTKEEAQALQRMQFELDELYEINAEKDRKLETIQNECRHETQTMINSMIDKTWELKCQKRQREIENEHEEIKRKKKKEYFGDQPTLF